MKTLITGGAGFIGSNYLHYVVNKYPNEEFVCIDALTYAGNYENLIQLEDKSNFRFIKMDITDREKVFNLFEEEKFDAVINFAAESHVDNSIKNPEIFLKTKLNKYYEKFGAKFIKTLNNGEKLYKFEL